MRLSTGRVALFAAALALLVVAPAVVAQRGAERGRATFVVPEPTADGDWYGTWYHESRERNMAIWIRKGVPNPEIQVRYFRLGGAEQFVSDWQGQATYATQEGAPGRFGIDLSSASEERMSATWHWTLDFTDSARIETGSLSVYRSGDGRMLVLLFDEFERRIRRGATWESSGEPHALTFRKVSKRLVAWDELPF